MDEKRETLETAGRIDELALELAQRLSGAPSVAELPADSARPRIFDQSAARILLELSPAAAASCDDLATALGITRDAVLLGAWGMVLARQCGVEDLLIGVPVTGRPYDDSRHLVGQCSGPLPVRIRLEAGLTAAQYLRRTQASLAEAARFADVPFAGLVRAAGVVPDPGRHPLVQFAFESQDGPIPHRLQAGGSLWDAMLTVQWRGAGCRLALTYATAALGPAEAGQLAESLEAALRGLAAGRDSQLAGVSTVSAGQELLLQEWGRGADAPADSLWGLLSRRAALSAHEPAVRADGLEITYAELLARAEALAVRLHAAGVGPGDHVLIDMPRGLDEIVSVLAACRLGAVYVGVDRHMPAAQRQDIAARLTARALLVSGSRPASMRSEAGSGCSVIDAALAVPSDPKGLGNLPAPPSDPESPAYVSFTSGSTGKPKGVRIPQRGVVRLVGAAQYVRRGPGERFLRLSPLAFDASVLEIFAPLTGGACLHVFTAEPVLPGALAQFIVKHRLTVMWLTAGLFRLMADHYPQAFAAVRQILTGGDVVPAEQVRALSELHDGLRITNGYGPTESTTFTTVHHVDSTADLAEPLPIGRPIPGTDVLVADGAARAVPPGAIGELWIGGQGLALDYLGDEAATREAFVSRDGRKMYRTGDLVRWDELGRLRFAGRRDRQVKISGHRVEPVAIERALREHPGVRDVVIVVDDSASFGPRLLAAVTFSEGALSSRELRDYVGQRFPGYAVPALWALVETIPLTANGKVDVAALRRDSALVGP